MIVEIIFSSFIENQKEVNAILAQHNVEVLKSEPHPKYYYKTYLTFRIKDNIELNKLMLDINENSCYGAQIVKTQNTPEIHSENFLKRLFKKKTLPCKTFVGYVSRYSDCWLFETEKTSYSQQVCATIDELMGEFSKDGDKFKITIEKLEK